MYQFLEDVTNPESFAPYRLGSEVRLPQWAVQFVAQMAVGCDVAVSLPAQTPRGSLTANYVAEFGSPSVLVQVQLVLRTRQHGCEDRFWSVVKPFRRSPVLQGVWLAEAELPILVEVPLLSAPLCFVIVQGRVVV